MHMKNDWSTMNGSSYTEEVFTVSEMAEFMMISKGLAYNLLKSGKVKAKRINKLWRVPKSSILEYLKNPE